MEGKESDAVDLCNISEIKTLLRRHGFQFSRSMGQNFLIAPWVPLQTAESSGAAPGVAVLEIGPGIGPLTAALADLAEKVLSVELDRSLLPILQETLAAYPNVEIISGDILKTDIRALCADKLALRPLVACANLPYNITTPVITALLEADCFDAITVMIQREVALRICAQPGTSDYGSFSVFCQYHADCHLLYDVEPTCFHPAPKVMSSVIRLNPRREKPADVSDPSMFFRVVRASFAQRRKTLVNGLYAAFGAEFDKAQLERILEDCSLSKTIRGERLGIAEFARIAQKLEG